MSEQSNEGDVPKELHKPPAKFPLSRTTASIGGREVLFSQTYLVIENQELNLEVGTTYSASRWPMAIRFTDEKEAKTNWRVRENRLHLEISGWQSSVTGAFVSPIVIGEVEKKPLSIHVAATQVGGGVLAHITLYLGGPSEQ